MGRSVARPNDAVVVCYQDVTDLDSDDWQYHLDGLRYTAQQRWKSFDDCDIWVGNELHGILENCHAYVVVAEYCGLASISLVPRDNDHPELSAAWCERIADNFRKAFGQYAPIATASNGETFYRKIGE